MPVWTALWFPNAVAGQKLREGEWPCEALRFDLQPLEYECECASIYEAEAGASCLKADSPLAQLSRDSQTVMQLSGTCAPRRVLTPSPSSSTCKTIAGIFDLAIDPDKRYRTSVPRSLADSAQTCVSVISGARQAATPHASSLYINS